MHNLSVEEITSYLGSLAKNDVEREMIASSAYRYAECLKYYLADLAVSEPRNVVEIGTGRGWVSLLVKHYFPHHSVTALDVHIEPQVRERLEAHGIHAVSECKFGSGKELPVESGRFDLCIFFEVLEHIIEDPRHVFREIARIIAPGGRLLFTTPNLAYLFSRILLLAGIQPQFFLTGLRHGRQMPRNHFREWTMRELDILLTDSGFAVTRSGYLYGHGGEGVARRKWYLRLAVSIFRLIVMAKPSFRGVIAMVGEKQPAASASRQK